jgi:hypothetical protein
VAYDIAPANVIINGPVFIGIAWRGDDPYSNFDWVYISGDEGRRTARRQSYYYIDYLDRDPPPPTFTSNGFSPWGDLYIEIPKAKALGIRAIFGPLQ